MEEILLERLHNYIRLDHPDLMIALNKEHKFSLWLSDKVATVKNLIVELEQKGRPEDLIEECCMTRLTADLRPSRFAYLKELLEECFEWEFQRMNEAGITVYEIIGLIGKCNQIFDDFHFCETSKENHALKRVICAVIRQHLQTGK